MMKTSTTGREDNELYALIRNKDGSYVAFNDAGDSLERKYYGYVIRHGRYPLWLNIPASLASHLSWDGNDCTEAIYFYPLDDTGCLDDYAERVELSYRIENHYSKAAFEKNKYNACTTAMYRRLADETVADEKGLIYQVAILMHCIPIAETPPTPFIGSIAELLSTPSQGWRIKFEKWGNVGNALIDEPDPVSTARAILTDVNNVQALSEFGISVKVVGNKVRIHLVGEYYKHLLDLHEIRSRAAWNH